MSLKGQYWKQSTPFPLHTHSNTEKNIRVQTRVITKAKNLNKPSTALTAVETKLQILNIIVRDSVTWKICTRPKMEIGRALRKNRAKQKFSQIDGEWWPWQGKRTSRQKQVQEWFSPRKGECVYERSKVRRCLEFRSLEGYTLQGMDRAK